MLVSRCYYSLIWWVMRNLCGKPLLGVIKQNMHCKWSKHHWVTNSNINTWNELWAEKYSKECCWESMECFYEDVCRRKKDTSWTSGCQMIDIATHTKSLDIFVVEITDWMMGLWANYLRNSYMLKVAGVFNVRPFCI